MKFIFIKSLFKAAIPFGLSLLGAGLTKAFLNSPEISFGKPDEVLYVEIAKPTNWIWSEVLANFYWFITIMIIFEVISSAFCLIKNCSSKGLKQTSSNSNFSHSDISQSLHNNSQIMISGLKKAAVHGLKMTLLYSLCYLLYLMTFLLLSFIIFGNVHNQGKLTRQDNLFTEFRVRSLQNSGAQNASQPLLNLTLTTTSSPTLQYLFESPQSVVSSIISSDDSTIFVVIDMGNENLFEYKLEIYDISTKSSVVFLGGLFIQNYATQVSLALSNDEQTLFMIENNASQIINVSNWTSPQIITSFSPIGNDAYPKSLIYDDDAIYLLTSSGLQIIDVSDVSNPAEASVFSQANSYCLSPDGNIIFLYYGGNLTISIVNITDIQSPEQITSFSYNQQFSPTLSIYQQALFIWDGLSMEVYNVSDLANPNLITTQQITQPGDTQVTFSSDYQTLYVLNGSTFQILNASDYSFSPISTQIPIPNSDSGSLVFTLLESPDGRHILFNTVTGFIVFDVSDPSSPFSLPLINLAQLSPGSIVGLGYTFSSNGQTLLANIQNSYGSDFSVIQLALNIQANQAINFQENIISIENWAEQFDYPGDLGVTTALTADNTLLYVSNPYTNIQPVNISDPNNYVWLPEIEAQLIDIEVSSDGQYLYGLTNSQSNFEIFSLADNQTIFDYAIPNAPFFSYTISQDYSTAVIYNENLFVVLDISNPNNVSSAYNMTIPGSNLETVLLSNDCNFAFLAENMGHLGYYIISIYDISTVSSPILISNISVPFTDIALIQNMGMVYSNNTLFTMIYQYNGANILNAIDISTLQAPNIIATVYLPLCAQGTCTNPVLVPMIPSGEVLLVGVDNAFGAFDVSIPSSPTLLASYQMQIYSVAVSSNASTLFLLNGSDIITVTLKPQNMLFLEFNEWALGAPYPTALNAYAINSNGTYDIMANYKYTNLSLYSPSMFFTTQSETSLPNWITFDKSTGFIAFLQDSQAPLGFHILSGTFSTQIPNNTFIGTASINNTDDSLSLLITLITLGYVDNQLYLTSSFNPDQPMFLTSQYAANETQIRQTLSQYYLEASTSIYIKPSLSIVFPNPPSSSITISTLSQEPLNILISIGSNNSQPMFVTSGITFSASFSQNNTVISMIRSLLDANDALSQVVIYLNGSESCDGNITVVDGLNPTLFQFVPNISSYFNVSLPPKINASYFQSQVSKVSPATGNQFVLQFDSATFTDVNNEPLTVSLEMQDSNSQVPDWLELKDLALIGTPPNKLSGRQLDFTLIVSNQYQWSEINFSLDVSISLEYFLALFGQYLGYLITVVGLLIYGVDIYNIVGKRFYTYSKAFVVRSEQVIDPKVIYPIPFAGRPLSESKEIIRHLDKTISQELKSNSKLRIAEFFTNQDSYRIDRVRLVQAIEEAANELSKNDKTKLKLYTPVVSSEKELINQIIFNTFVLRLLDSDRNKETKKAFNRIKRKLFSLVALKECLPDGTCTFSAIKSKLFSELRAINAKINTQAEDKSLDISQASISTKVFESQKSENLPKRNSLEDSLVSNHNVSRSQGNQCVDIDFLVYAIKAYAFNNHLVNYDIHIADIIAKQQSQSSWGYLEGMRKFLKFDLQSFGLSKKSIVGYGIKYQIKGSSLVFSGKLDHLLSDMTLVLQIITKRKRILREIWIHGVEDESEKIELQEEVL